MTKNEWQVEFPNLYKLFTSPLIFLIDVPEKISKLIKSVVFFATLLLLIWVFYFHAHEFFATGDLTKMTNYFSNNDYGMFVWIKYRNFLLSLMMLDLILSSIVVFISIVRSEFEKVIKFGGGWILLLLFLMFSYAIAELISKIIVWL